MKIDDKFNDYILERYADNSLFDKDLVCPNCSVTLQINSEVYNHGKKEMIGIQVNCSKCDLAIVFDAKVKTSQSSLKNDNVK